MKILLINTNRERSPQTLVPLGACCVASAAETAGHFVRLLDLCFERAPSQAVLREVQKFQPDVIGLSIRNLDNCDYENPKSYLPEIRELVDICKRGCRSEIVIGGAAVSQAPEALARYLGCRLAVSGEGEVAFPSLLSALESGRDPAGIPGVTVVYANTAHSTPPDHITDLSLLGCAHPMRWLDLKRYARYDASAPIQTKRGCPFECSYCVYPLLEGAEPRLKPPEEVAEEVVWAAKSGMPTVDFVDSVWGIPQDHAFECCEAIIRRNTPAKLTTLDLNPVACTSQMIDAMNAAGFTAVGVTAESGSNNMLQSLNKGFNVDQLREAARNLRRLHAQKLWMFMLGAPGENERTVRETSRFIDELPTTDLVLITQGVRVLPGTVLQKKLVDYGIIRPNDSLIEPTFYYSFSLTPKRAREILASGSFPSSNMVSLTDSGHRLAPAVQRLASMLKLRPPYWRHIPLINRSRRVLGI